MGLTLTEKILRAHIVDGEFKKELLDEKLHWKGSANQRVIEVPETLKVGRIVLFDD